MTWERERDPFSNRLLCFSPLYKKKNKHGMTVLEKKPPSNETELQLATSDCSDVKNDERRERTIQRLKITASNHSDARAQQQKAFASTTDRFLAWVACSTNSADDHQLQPTTVETAAAFLSQSRRIRLGLVEWRQRYDESSPH